MILSSGINVNIIKDYLCRDGKKHILNFLNPQFIIETMRLISKEWKNIIESNDTVNILLERDFNEEKDEE